MSGKTAFEHGGNVYSAAREKGNLSEIIDFSANINPLGLSSSVRKAITDALESVVHYPDPNAEELRQAVSRFYEVDEKLITLGNGAVEPIYILCQLLSPRRVLITAPTFGEYERAALAAGAEILPVILEKDNEFQIVPEKIILKLAGCDMVFITNPNNPTGTLLTAKEIEKIISAAKEQGSIVIVDESFMDFLRYGLSYSVKPLLRKYDNLVVLHSLTKFYAIPGLRLGFMLANEEITRKLHLSKDPWNVNSLAQAAGIAAINDFEYRCASISYMEKASVVFYQELNKLPGVKAYLPSVNFILLDIEGTGLTAAELCQKAFQYNILLRDCSNYRGLSDKYIRVAVKRFEDNTRLTAVLQHIIARRGSL